MIVYQFIEILKIILENYFWMHKFMTYELMLVKSRMLLLHCLNKRQKYMLSYILYALLHRTRKTRQISAGYAIWEFNYVLQDL